MNNQKELASGYVKGYTHIPAAEGPETKEYGMLKNYHEKKKRITMSLSINRIEEKPGETKT